MSASASSEVRLALIGCGAAARAYYQPILKKRPQLSRNLHCVDREIERAKELAHSLGSPHFSGQHEDVLDRVHGAIITTPHFLHYPIAMDCLKRRLHVLCEKPLSATADHACALVDEAEKQGVTLSVNNTWRMFPAFREIHRLLSTGHLGRLREITIIEGQKFDWESYSDFYVNPQVSAKGVLLDVGAHVLDLVCWWVGGTPELISCEDDSFGGPESVVAIRATRGECAIEIHLNRLVDVEPLFVVAGERGTIQCSASDWNAFGYASQGKKMKTLKVRTRVRTYWELVEGIVENFTDVILAKGLPLVPARAVLPSMMFLDECYARRSSLPMPWFERLESLVDG